MSTKSSTSKRNMNTLLNEVEVSNFDIIMYIGSILVVVICTFSHLYQLTTNTALLSGSDYELIYLTVICLDIIHYLPKLAMGTQYRTPWFRISAYLLFAALFTPTYLIS